MKAHIRTSPIPPLLHSTPHDEDADGDGQVDCNQLFQRRLAYHGIRRNRLGVCRTWDIASSSPVACWRWYLPLSAAVGLSWQKFPRSCWRQNYMDISVLSIAANGKDMSFSSDTGMAECLVVARKLRKGAAPAAVKNGSLHILHTRRPQKFEHAAAVASVIDRYRVDIRQRDKRMDLMAARPLMVGDEKTGEMLTAPHDSRRRAHGQQ